MLIAHTQKGEKMDDLIYRQDDVDVIMRYANSGMRRTRDTVRAERWEDGAT